MQFKSFKTTLWIDEVWFYLKHLTVDRKHVPGFPDFPDDTTQHKQDIPKVMFIIVVGIPHLLPDGNFYDGKIGIRPLVHYVPAAWSSRNRPRGTIEITNVSITGEEYKNQLLYENGILENIDHKLGI